MGKFIGFHIYRGSMGADMPGYEDKYIYGRNPVECILANFRNLKEQDTDFLGGYAPLSRAPVTHAATKPRALALTSKAFLNQTAGGYAHVHARAKRCP
ncbi:MAG: hypothetical protein IPO07_25090 [Haliscomenobacter sp.]|nr:hypothetical protein [Haliscomenobacter sp.]MBK9491707.1 hypothetical protein [Haliscomenobacter sp.]